MGAILARGAVRWIPRRAQMGEAPEFMSDDDSIGHVLIWGNFGAHGAGAQCSGQSKSLNNRR